MSVEQNDQEERLNVFGEQLRSIRKREKLTQRDLGKLSGISNSFISRIETGYSKPPRKTSFYEGLRKIPGISDQDIATLLQVGSPMVSTPDFNLNLLSLNCILAPQEGIRIQIYTDPEKVGSHLLEAIKAEIVLGVNAVIDREAERVRRVEEYFPRDK